MPKALFKDLGVGVGLRPAHYSEFFTHPPASVDFVEVVTENYLPPFGQNNFPALDRLMKVRQNKPVVMHGVSLSIASADPLDRAYLKRLKETAQLVQPEWISDHLCWTGVNGENFHDLLPIPYTKKNAAYIAERIQRVQDFLGERILLENVSSYLEYKSSEMTEWEFVTDVIETADCGLLLDINNVFVSGFNHGFDPARYLQSIPFHRVGQIHLAGHSQCNGHRVDTHDADICPEVWELYRFVVQNLGKIGTMVERDGNIPEWNVLEKEVLQIAKIRNEWKDRTQRNEKGEQKNQQTQPSRTADGVRSVP